jgi:tetratricopeptide (TPR) repeat protein
MLYFNRCIALFKSGKMKEVEEDFDKSLILDPRMVNAPSHRGLCREKLGKEKAALEDLRVYECLRCEVRRHRCLLGR